MAEEWTRAFGRYLRTLRERKGLSLTEVASLSQAFAETVHKGYLSRCENGHQGLAFSKVIPLSRIYGIPADALLERLELDMELDRVGGPETEGLSFAELTKGGSEALQKGYRWLAYAYLRDAVGLASTAPIKPAFRDRADQFGCSQMSCGTAAKALGRFRFALHEFTYLESAALIGDRFQVILLERLAETYRHLNKSDLGRKYADQAVREAEKNGEQDYLGYVYSCRARQAIVDTELDLAADLFQKAYRTFRDAGRVGECARCLNNLAQIYFDTGRYRSARRALNAASTLVGQAEQHGSMAYGRLLLGEIEALEANTKQAEQHWKQAASIAKQLDDKALRFKAEYLLLQHATREGNQAVARSIYRRLRRLSNWIPKDLPELHDFQKNYTDLPS